MHHKTTKNWTPDTKTLREAEAIKAWAQYTRRRKQHLYLLARGLDITSIAHELFLAEVTVNGDLTKAFGDAVVPKSFLKGVQDDPAIEEITRPINLSSAALAFGALPSAHREALRYLAGHYNFDDMVQLGEISPRRMHSIALIARGRLGIETRTQLVELLQKILPEPRASKILPGLLAPAA